MRDPQTLAVFGKADALVIEVYRLTSVFPPEEKFSLTSQVRRAAVSVASNLVEGCSRASEKEFARFVEIALGSSMELEYQLGLARRLVEMQRGELLGIPARESREAVEAAARRTEDVIAKFPPVIERASEVTRMLISFGKTLRSDS